MNFPRSALLTRFPRFSTTHRLCASINSKLSDTQAELHEHKMVKTALEPLEDERKCFRLLGSVLVEKTKGEVLPAILEQMSSLEKLAVSYGEQVRAIPSSSPLALTPAITRQLLTFAPLFALVRSSKTHRSGCASMSRRTSPPTSSPVRPLPPVITSPR